MKRACLALSTVALTATGLAAADVAAAEPVQTASADCSHLYVLTDGRGRGLTGKTWDDAGTTVPAGAQMDKFRYDDGIVPGVHPHSLDETRRVAAPALAQKVLDFHRACPGSPVTLVGYSFGALISGDAVELLAAKNEVPHELLNAVLIADPRRHVADTASQGPSGGIMSVAPDGPGMHTPGPRDFRGVKVASICREDDLVCNAANPISNAQAFTGEMQRLPTAHGAYGDADPNRNYWARPANFADVGDLVLPPSAPITWGPAAFPAPMPRELLNDNEVYKGAMDGLTQSGDALAWANVLNTFGLPGDEIVHGFWKALQEAGAGY
ncbi:cutinase family protein [Saccharopolyspora sp. NPDC002686]|uniref:cutinase family protein n=1 Tax=Saccharopolyspora sp. NPDC002686 TaxID=3154541 RepID=UPI003331D22A